MDGDRKTNGALLFKYLDPIEKEQKEWAEVGRNPDGAFTRPLNEWSKGSLSEKIQKAYR